MGTTEWNDEGARHAAADSLEGKVGGNVGKSYEKMRKKSSVDLRKPDYFFLCQLWGYRSNLWCLKKWGVHPPTVFRSLPPEARRAPTPPSPLSDWELLDPARTSPLFTLGAVHGAFERDIRPLLERTSAYSCCPRAEAAARSGESGSILLPSFWRTASTVLGSLAQSGEGMVKLHGMTVSVWLSQVSDGTVRDGCTPAILALQGRKGPAELVINLIRAQAESWCAGTVENLRRAQSTGGRHRVDEAYQSDMLISNTANMEAMSRMLAILRVLEMGPITTYLQVSEYFLSRVAAQIPIVVGTLRTRFGWIQEVSAPFWEEEERRTAESAELKGVLSRAVERISEATPLGQDVVDGSGVRSVLGSRTPDPAEPDDAQNAAAGAQSAGGSPAASDRMAAAAAQTRPAAAAPRNVQHALSFAASEWGQLPDGMGQERLAAAVSALPGHSAVASLGCGPARGLPRVVSGGASGSSGELGVPALSAILSDNVSSGAAAAPEQADASSRAAAADAPPATERLAPEDDAATWDGLLDGMRPEKRPRGLSS